MSIETFFRFCAIASITAGLSIIVGAVLNDLLKTSKGTFFNFLGALIGLFGVTGTYLWQRAESGTFGFIAYIAVFIGLALIACNDYFGALIGPSVSADEYARLGETAAMRYLLISSFIFLVGEILFGISVLRAGLFSKIATVLFMIGFFATPMRSAYPIITFIGLTLSGTGLIWWGVSLFSMTGGG